MIPQPFYLKEAIPGVIPGAATGGGNNCLIPTLPQLVRGNLGGPAMRPNRDKFCAKIHRRLAQDYQRRPTGFLGLRGLGCADSLSVRPLRASPTTIPPARGWVAALWLSASSTGGAPIPPPSFQEAWAPLLRNSALLTRRRAPRRGRQKAAAPPYLPKLACPKEVAPQRRRTSGQSMFPSTKMRHVSHLGGGGGPGPAENGTFRNSCNAGLPPLTPWGIPPMGAAPW